MELIVYAGPSLCGVSREAWPTIEFRPPAACGDIARAADSRPRAIGLIDGLFETTASPRHKEILWALSKGIAVLGGASLGALRAAELSAFGMIGVGRIFEAYRDRAIENDAEVAVLHGPAELGYPNLTEALVNVRCALSGASRAGIISAADRALLLEAASAIFYKDRSWALILGRATGLGVLASAIEALGGWLAENPVDAKREDALELLAAIASPELSSRRAGVEPAFVDTVFFADLRRRLRIGES
jgi:hypothetical protein